MSLNPQTLRIRLQLERRTKSGQKHWDIYRHLYNPFVLMDATKLVMLNAGAAGIDGVECADIRGKEWEYAVKLCEEIKASRATGLATSAVRRVYIPKADGSLRPLGIPTIRDRVLQRAICLLLEPVYEQIFLPCSYGFRPGKKSVHCMYDVAEVVYRHRHILDADIEGFFDNVVHRKLQGMLKEQIVDSRLLKLITGFLTAGFCEWNKPWKPTEKGTPQGGPLSPLLANIYLHYALDRKFAALKSSTARLFRFADDFVIACKTETELKMLNIMLVKWLREAGLKLKPSKTRLVNMENANRSHDSKFDFLGFKFHLRAHSLNVTGEIK